MFLSKSVSKAHLILINKSFILNCQQQKQANQAIPKYYELIRMPGFKAHLEKIKALKIVPFDGGNGRSQFLLLWRGSGFGRFPRWGWHNIGSPALKSMWPADRF
jgi:hypothetical protein